MTVNVKNNVWAKLTNGCIVNHLVWLHAAERYLISIHLRINKSEFSILHFLNNVIGIIKFAVTTEIRLDYVCSKSKINDLKYHSYFAPF